MTDRSVKSLANLLTKQNGVQAINLEGNDLTHHGIKILAESLKGNQSLHTLNLRGNKIGDGGAKALASVIGTTAIQILDVGCCDIRTEGWTALCVKLSGNSTISDLSLSNARLQSCELIHTCKMILTTPSLQRLSLSRLGRALNDEQCVHLAEYLQNNESLTFLDLSSCSIGADGVHALRQVLCQAGEGGCALEHLVLSYNRLSEHAAHDIAAIIQKSSLRILDLCGCNFHDEGLTILAKATTDKAKGLSKLCLDGNWFGRQAKQAWQQTMKKVRLKIDFAANISDEATEYNLGANEGFIADKY